MLKHLTLLKIRNIMDINVDLLQWFINFLIKKSSGDVATLGSKSAVKNENMSNKEFENQKKTKENMGS